MRHCFLPRKVFRVWAQASTSSRSSCNPLIVDRLRVTWPSFSSRLVAGLTCSVTLHELFSCCTLVSPAKQDGGHDIFPPLWRVLRRLDEICHVNCNAGFHSDSERAATADQWGKEGLIGGERWHTKNERRWKSQPMQDILGNRI